MKNIAISLLTAGILALPGAAILADEDDDDDDRRGRWHHRIERGYWYVPRFHPGPFDDWYGSGQPYLYDERFGDPEWPPYPPPMRYYAPPTGRYPPPPWYTPWEYERPRYGYWRWHPGPPRYFRDGRHWRWRHGDDDDDDDDDD